MRETAPRRVLCVAYHFPPLAGSSGIQRTLRFVQHLPGFGWQPLVLTTQERAYDQISPDQLQDIPAGTVVRRAFALDTARHLSVGGRYLAAMARPDRWVSWRFDGVRQGLKMVREFAPQAIWSTYPFATAHLIGGELARRTGLPWVADFRDPMAQEGYPSDAVTHAQFRQIEADVVRRAAISVFTTPSAAEEYRRRYPESAHKIAVLENGYDEESFTHAAELAKEGPLTPGCITLLHSGIVYPSERDPAQLIQALRLLHDAGQVMPGRLKLRFRAAVAEDLLRQLVPQHGVEAYVELLPAVPYRTALAEMLRADALLILQAANCNQQIPAKLYEYLRCGRPILALTDVAGDTARTLNLAGVRTLAPLDNAAAIAELLGRFIQHGAALAGTTATPAAVQSASRAGRTRVLAATLDALVGARQTAQNTPMG